MAQPRIKPLTNPYKLRPVVREEEVVVVKGNKPKPDLEEGGLATCSLKTVLYTMPNPVVVVKIIEDPGCKRSTNGWLVEINTTNGPQRIDCGYFKKYTGA